MVAVNIVMMVVVLAALAFVLSWAIVSDRRSKRASGGSIHPSEAPLNRNLVIPHEMRGARNHHFPKRRGRK